jgi:putative flippase GtrA
MKALFEKFGRVWRYGLVGAATTAFYTALMVGLHASNAIKDPTLAAGVAFVLTQPLAFLLHRRTTYGDVARQTDHLPRFLIVAAIMLGLTTASMKIVDMAGLPYWVGLLIGYGLIPAATYAINAIWVFRTRTFLGRDQP